MLDGLTHIDHSPRGTRVSSSPALPRTLLHPYPKSISFTHWRLSRHNASDNHADRASVFLREGLPFHLYVRETS